MPSHDIPLHTTKCPVTTLSYNKTVSQYPFIQQNSQSVPFHTTKCPVSTPSYNKMPSQYPFIQENDQSVPLHTRKWPVSIPSYKKTTSQYLFKQENDQSFYFKVIVLKVSVWTKKLPQGNNDTVCLNCHTENNLLLSSHEIASMLEKTVYKELEKSKSALRSCSRYLPRLIYKFRLNSWKTKYSQNVTCDCS